MIDVNKKNQAAKIKRGKSRVLKVGFVPLNDCAPLLMARELGLFTKYDLEVELQRELGWATIRDKVIYGELHAAHAVSGMPFSTTFGLGSIPCDCVTGLVLSLHGNAITLSQKLWDAGVRDAKSLREFVVRSQRQRTFTFGVVFPFSSHHFLMRQWLASAGINPDRDVRIVMVPPPQMFANLKAGNLDGYCVGEPWNSLAVQNRLGWCAATSSQLAPGHPEKVLLVRRSFAEERAAEHVALIAALIEACAYCDRPENAEHVIRVLARPNHLNTPPAALGQIRHGAFDFGGGRVEQVPEFQIFHGAGVNEPSPEKAAWVVRMMLQSGSISDNAPFRSPVARQIFRADIFHQARQLTSIPTHEHESQTEPTCLTA